MQWNQDTDNVLDFIFVGQFIYIFYCESSSYFQDKIGNL